MGNKCEYILSILIVPTQMQTKKGTFDFINDVLSINCVVCADLYPSSKQ